MITDGEKLEVVEQCIQHERTSPRKDWFKLQALKDIATDIRARQHAKIVSAEHVLGEAIRHAEAMKQPRVGYRPGHLHQIGELTIGMWPVIRQALEKFGKENDDG